MGRATYTPQSTLTMPVCQRPMYERRRASAGSKRAAGTVGCVSAGIGSGEHSSLQGEHLHQYTYKYMDSAPVYCRVLRRRLVYGLGM